MQLRDKNQCRIIRGTTSRYFENELCPANASLDNNAPCALCTTKLSTLLSYLTGPTVGNVSDCCAYTAIYAASLSDQYGPTSPGTAKCLFGLDFPPTLRCNKRRGLLARGKETVLASGLDSMNQSTTLIRFTSEIEAVLRLWMSNGPNNLLEKGAVLLEDSGNLYKAYSTLDLSVHNFKVRFALKLTFGTLPYDEDAKITKSEENLTGEESSGMQWDDDCSWSQWYSTEDPVKGFELIAIWSEKMIQNSMEMAELENASPHNVEKWLISLRGPALIPFVTPLTSDIPTAPYYDTSHGDTSRNLLVGQNPSPVRTLWTVSDPTSGWTSQKGLPTEGSDR
ncbi:hypothetical protein Fmac_005807 [Flemingia macrophylla]|uniref:Uncharacterized protein n=1 Tax=Flemingia macrophylla TaxID=520843 RepID=A0ABD1N9Y2_9FABA